MAVQRHGAHHDAGAALASDTADVRFAGGEIAERRRHRRAGDLRAEAQGRAAQGRANRIDYDLQARHRASSPATPGCSDGRTEVTGETLVYSTANQRVDLATSRS